MGKKRKGKKHNYTDAQLANLSRGRAPRKKRKKASNVFKRGNKYYRHFGTSMSDDKYRYGKTNPSPATFTKIDQLHSKVIESLPRIDKARPKNMPRTMLETTMLLQFILRFIYTNVCLLSYAVSEASQIFGWDRGAIFKATKSWLNGTDAQPVLKEQKKRGRGAAEFKRRYGDQFMTIKYHHAVAILEYVTLANKQRGGMVTIGRIQAHLLEKFGKLFKKGSIKYCLKNRLGIRFTDAGKPKITFTPERKRSAIVFCKNFDEALKLERAGTHVIVYMDESYCQGNHRPRRVWKRKDEDVTRCRGKGALTIIVHAITSDGFLCGIDGDRYDVDEWTTGPHPTTEMVFRAKYATKNKIKDYHDTMDGEFFLYWVKHRLEPAFTAKYPGKKMILCLDNAPYHHSLVADGFRPDGMSKDEIIDRLPTLRRKRRVPRLKEIKVRPFADQVDPPPLPDPRKPEDWIDFVFVDDSGEVWLVDGINDEGYGDAVIYSRVGAKKAGAVESTLVETFVDRLTTDNDESRWYILGHGDSTKRFIRSSGLLNARNRIPRVRRADEDAVDALRANARQYSIDERDTEYVYKLRDLGKRYNGAGFRGTGGPKVQWLRYAVNEYIQTYYPELQTTLLQEFFRTKPGWILLFTVPYWASSQPIEQVWAFVKNYVSLRWFPGRTARQLRSQILCGMYGRARAGSIAGCWTEIRGLKERDGLTRGLATKFILHSMKSVNDFIAGNRYLSHMGQVGEWDQEDIDRLVLPTCGDLVVDEGVDIDDNVAEQTIIDDIVNNM